MFAWLNFFQKVIIAIGAWLASQIISLLFIVQEGYADIYNADGSFNRREKLALRFWNGITTAGINNLFNVYFGATSKASAWYLGLIASSGYSALSAADTISSHAGWTEETSNYSQTNRPTWTPASASGGSVSNSSSVDFTFTGSVTVKGVFVVNENTKGGTTGTLWATALFTSGDQALVNGQTLKVTYICSGSSS
ncbi:MAG: hypothetical protein E6R03_10395 [Hyphomicrobiaceae bacterium]|nr:MAG: hypothetical protein E6R03_10395 [Hyphomicrobiaceae bacterium]